MGCLYKLAELVSVLDMLVSFAHLCTISDYGEFSLFSFFLSMKWLTCWNLTTFGKCMMLLLIKLWFKVFDRLSLKFVQDFVVVSLSGSRLVRNSPLFRGVFLFWSLMLVVLEFNFMISLEVYLLYLGNVTQSNLANRCVTYLGGRTWD